MKKVIIFTDGACKGNPGPGGWGVLLQYNQHEKIISGAEPHTTNNRMELLAAIRALESLLHPCEVDLYTDSQYLQKGITEWLPNWKKRGWKTADKKPVKNIDLWHMLDHETNKHALTWHWVKGHSNHPENDRVDEIANQAIENLLHGKS